jgi:hypothetical protein
LLGLVDPRQQPLGSVREGFISDHLGVEDSVALALVGAPPHPFWLCWEGRSHAWVAAEALPDLVGASQRAMPCALTGLRQPVLCNRFTSIERQAPTVVRPEPLGRPVQVEIANFLNTTPF